MYSENHITYLLTPWCRVLEKLTVLKLVKKFPAFHGTRMFITALTSVRHLSLSWTHPIQSIYPHPTSWIYVLIFSIHLSLGLPSGLFPSGFPHQDPLHPPHLTHTRHTPSSSHAYRLVKTLSRYERLTEVLRTLVNEKITLLQMIFGQLAYRSLSKLTEAIIS